MAAFDVKKVDLQGTNLIEASAGTGKTWSVAVMVLRLILEKKIPVEKILMVTFTNAAVAELEERIRKFVREAFRYASHKQTDNAVIREVVGEPDEQKFRLLKNAVQSLDQLAVMTIHRFCQEMISCYPFEAGQAFDSTLMDDPATLVEFHVNECWRQQINTLEDLKVFGHINRQLSRQDMMAVALKMLGDREYVYPKVDRAAIEKELKKDIEAYEEAMKAYGDHMQENWEELSARKSNSYGDKLKADNPTPEAFAKAFLKKADDAPGYFTTYFPHELALAQEIFTKQEQLKECTRLFTFNFYGQTIKAIRENVTRHKQERNLISFDDLISILHQAVSKGEINRLILKKYDAVFIDEFQDTDKKQYEIFHTLFAPEQDKLLFYIGDPKQSIYGWRKADMATYKAARAQVNVLHTMNQNFRSTSDFVDALNAFLGIDNPFYDQDIEYQQVEKGDIPLGNFEEDGKPVKPLAINSLDNNEQIVDYVRTEILRLLTTPGVLIDGKPLKPSHIAVLVRGAYQGDAIQAALKAAGIPSVTLDDASVFSSADAAWMQNLLEVVIQPHRGSINKLLLSPYAGFSRNDIEKLNHDAYLDVFRQLRKEWADQGIYNMLFSFFDSCNLISNCLSLGLSGQRSLSNIFQMAELLHLQEQKTRCSAQELLVWLISRPHAASEAYEQRLESEEEAVRITTIHKSKGLTYEVVFAPFLDLRIKEDVALFDFRDSQGYKFAHRLTTEQEKLWREQQEQENRRLLYVALTRARYKTYICQNRAVKESSLKPFLSTQCPLFEHDKVQQATSSVYEAAAEPVKFSPRIPQITYADVKPTFGIHSFSALNSKHYASAFESVELEQGYDRFIFQELGRGAAVGTALHSIFERIDFNKPDTWGQSLQEAAKFYPNILKEELLNHFKALVEHTLETDIPISGEFFQLKQISREKMLPEMQFNFSIKDEVSKQKINDMLGDEARLGGEATLQGLMTGFIDLIFEHKGKYYILDWKSNHLGNTLEDYTPQALDEAMKASNYTLQYLIYTLAVKRWLQSRIPDFDYQRHFGGVIYLYLRGLRQGKDTGIYSCKPEAEKIQALDALLS